MLMANKKFVLMDMSMILMIRKRKCTKMILFSTRTKADSTRARFFQTVTTTLSSIFTRGTVPVELCRWNLARRCQERCIWTAMMRMKTRMITSKKATIARSKKNLKSILRAAAMLIPIAFDPHGLTVPYADTPITSYNTVQYRWPLPYRVPKYCCKDRTPVVARNRARRMLALIPGT